VRFGGETEDYRAHSGALPEKRDETPAAGMGDIFTKPVNGELLAGA